MQMTMQNIPILPPGGEQVLPAVKGIGGKTSAADTFAALLGNQIGSVSAGEGAGTPMAPFGAPFSLTQGEVAPLAVEVSAPGKEGAEAKTGEVLFPGETLSEILLTGKTPGQEVHAPQMEALPEGENLPAEVVEAPVVAIVPGQPPAAAADEVKKQTRLPEQFLPEAPAELPGVAAAPAPTEAGELPQQQVVSASAVAPESVPPLQAQWGEVVSLAKSAVPVPGPVAEKARTLPAPASSAAERAPGLMDRQFAELLGKQDHSAGKSGGARGVPEFRPAGNPVPSAIDPSMQKGTLVSSETASSASSPFDEALSTLQGVEEGRPNPIHPQPLHLGNGSQPVAERSTQTPAPAVHLPTGEVVPESRIVDQVVGRLAVGREGEGGSISMKLHPKELGEVTVDLVVEKDRVKAQIIAQNQQVQEVLEKHLPKLRSALENQGLKLDSLQVAVDSQGQGGESRSFFQEHQRPSTPARFAFRGETMPLPEVQPAAYSPSREGGINVRI